MNDFFIKKLNKKRIKSSRTQNFFFQKIKNQNNFFFISKKKKKEKKKKKNKRQGVKDLTHKSSTQVPIIK